MFAGTSDLCGWLDDLRSKRLKERKDALVAIKTWVEDEENRVLLDMAPPGSDAVVR